MWHSTLVGVVVTGLAGLGSNPKPCYNKARGKEKRELAEVEEARFSRVVGMSKQGAWTRQEASAPQKDSPPVGRRGTIEIPGHHCSYISPTEHGLDVCCKQAGGAELTVPCEDQMEEAQEKKRAKYADLIAECWWNGWKARCEPVEVGCRGFAGHTLSALPQIFKEGKERTGRNKRNDDAKVLNPGLMALSTLPSLLLLTLNTSLAPLPRLTSGLMVVVKLLQCLREEEYEACETPLFLTATWEQREMEEEVKGQ
ncbi:hypothetical protein FQN60_010929, partial [Etheostoma spectabile]